MTRNEIEGKVQAGAYRPKMDFPEPGLPGCEFSKQVAAYERSAKEGWEQFETDICTMLKSDSRFNDEQRQLIFNAALAQDSEDPGFYGMLYYIEECATFAANILAAQEK